jgi:membrane protein implicated in regulation of membrane protease activity
VLELLIEGGRYAVRAGGLALVAGVSVFLLFASLFGQKPSLLVAASSALAIAASVLSWPRMPKAWRADPPTDRQLAYAQQLGLVVPEGVSKGQLSDMISQATGR